MAFQGDSIFWVEVEKIVPNPFQPRREFDEMRLKELSESVRMYGILQPLTVTRREIQNEDGSFRSEYELIAGERRLRASKLAGLAQVPVIIREGDQSEQEKLELAIIENLQREDLNAVDRALAFRQLADVFGLSHSQVAQKVGRSREYVSNTIRLLALPDYMLTALRTADISEGHARTLLMLNDRAEEQDTVFREILLKKLSVREVERIARGIASEKIRKKGDYDADLVELEKKFTETLGTRVSIMKTEFGGRLSIDYFTQDDLMQMLERMKVEAAGAPPVVALSNKNMTELGPLNEPGELTTPRADELAILTDRTGLEVVPEKLTEEMVSKETVAPVAPTPVVQGGSAHTPAVTEENNPTPPAPSFTPATVSASPLTPTPPSTPNTPASSLRDQLASLLGTAPHAVTPVAAATVAQPAVPAVPTEITPPTPAKSIDTETDDSALYDLKNFSI
jgi:ParB family chromosome partitioning protein